MGMGYCGNFAVVISSESVASVVGEELYKPFLEVLKKISDEYKISEGDLVYNLEQGEDCADGDREISDKWNSILCEIEDKFLEQTGMSLSRCYHNSDENGSRYDDVDGPYWEISFEDAYVPSESLLKLNSKLESGQKTKICHFVTFG